MIVMRISGLISESIVDGPGLRFVVFFQGCLHNCYNCHNSHTHDLNGGYEITLEEIINKIKQNTYIDGITLSGGDPLFQVSECLSLIEEINKLNLNIIIYTGFTFEELIKMGESNEKYIQILEKIDCLIDGKFIENLKSLDLKYVGSSNQRLIDTKKSLKTNKIVLYDV